MRTNPRFVIVATLALLLWFIMPPAARAADPVKDAALEFASGWDEALAVLGFSGLAHFESFNEKKEALEPLRKILREQGTDKLRQEGERLDQIISYVVRTLHESKDANITAYAWRAPGGKPPARVPAVFRDAKMNALLGIEAGEEDPAKIVSAIRHAIRQFAKASGVAEQLATRKAGASKKEKVTPAR
jgi:hypothetical protein